jgi:hypothetical protein
MTTRFILWALVALGGCRPAEQTVAASTASAAGTESPACAAHGALEALDGRTPVPLLPMMAHHQKENMRDHLVAVQEIVGALAAKDFAAVEKAATRIGYSEQMGHQCSHMGAGAPGFTEQALVFHRTADRIGEAARKQDEAGVLVALGATLSTCTGCHAGFKQQVVDDAGFAAATKTAPPAAH